MPRVFIITALLVFTTLAVHAQEKKPSPTPKPGQTPSVLDQDEVVRISTELVQTDVMVFDKDGRFVNGLKQDEFELLVDGRPQPISFFESVVAGGANEKRALKAAGANNQSQPESGEDVSTDRGRTILFFINDLHLQPSSLARTHKLVNNFIDKQLGPNDEVAITSASGQIGFLQQLTDNPVVLRAALERLKFVPGAVSDAEKPYITEYAAYLIQEQHDRQLLQYYINETIKVMHVEASIAEAIVTQRVNRIVRQSDVIVKSALSSLVNLMKSTGKLSGRKLVFFISDGFLPNFSGSDFTTMVRRTTDSAARGGVVIYSLDAQGLKVSSSLDASVAGGFDPTGIQQSRTSGEQTFMQQGLYALAADTGGRAVLNTNDLEGGIARALEETSRYYLLAWRPNSEAQRASNFSKIKVTIAGHPELKVRLRRGYLGAPTEKAKTKDEPATVQVENTDVLGVTESSTEELRPALALGYKLTSANNMQLTSSLQVSAHAPEGGGGSVDTGVLGAVYDSNGKAVGSFKQRVEVPRTRAQGPPVYATVNHQVDVPPGLYQVRAIAYERGTRRVIGTIEWIEIPKIKPGTFAISSLYVGEISEAAGTAPVSVNASRRFARSSHLRFTTYIYNAKTPPQLGVQIKILRDGQAVITPPEAKVATEKLTNFATITYTGEFPLVSLPPGNYLLDVTVLDHVGNNSASQQLKFTVY